MALYQSGKTKICITVNVNGFIPIRKNKDLYYCKCQWLYTNQEKQRFVSCILSNNRLEELMSFIVLENYKLWIIYILRNITIEFWIWHFNVTPSQQTHVSEEGQQGCQRGDI